MSTLADAAMAALRGNHDELAATVRGFDEASLAMQSGASEWDVAQVLSHLASGAEIMLASLRAGVAGTGRARRGFCPLGVGALECDGRPGPGRRLSAR